MKRAALASLVTLLSSATIPYSLAFSTARNPQPISHTSKTTFLLSPLQMSTQTKTSSEADAATNEAKRTSKGGYTDEELKVALKSIEGPTPEVTCKHLLGYDDWKNHEISMLQRITATRILDYRKKLADPSTPTEQELLNRAKQFHTDHGPILNLRNVIQSKSPSMALAAEFKRSSPSKGDIAPNLNAGTQAHDYATAGASVISVLTEGHWFKGSLKDLTEARLSTTGKKDEYDRPAILCKEFITNKYMILEAISHGADTVLLIVATTPADLLKELIDYARSMNMEPLVEVHAYEELDVALNAGAKVIGVNNRNLHTFQMDLGTTDKTAAELKKRGLEFDHNSIIVPSDGDDDTKSRPEYVVCALSGMSSASDVQRYRQVGVGMCLIGESLMRAADPKGAIASLCLDPADFAKMMTEGGGGGLASAYTGGTKIVKVCGITNPDDALIACQAGANLIGVIFVPKSKRCVTPTQAKDVVNAVRSFGERSIRTTIPSLSSDKLSPIQNLIMKSKALEDASRRPLVVGVFQNQDHEYIREMVEQCGLDLVQLHGTEGMEAASVDLCGVPALRVVDIETDDSDDGEGTKTSSSSSSSSREGAIEKILDSLTSDPIAILLDTSIKGNKDGGGTGVTFDWGIAESIQNRGLPVLIAGGLKPDNVRDAVTGVRPWGIDVSSGVEVSPGKKDGDKVKEFVKGVREAAEEASKGF